MIVQLNSQYILAKENSKNVDLELEKKQSLIRTAMDSIS